MVLAISSFWKSRIQTVLLLTSYAHHPCISIIPSICCERRASTHSVKYILTNPASRPASASCNVAQYSCRFKSHFNRNTSVQLPVTKHCALLFLVTFHAAWFVPCLPAFHTDALLRLHGHTCCNKASSSLRLRAFWSVGTNGSTETTAIAFLLSTGDTSPSANNVRTTKAGIEHCKPPCSVDRMSPNVHVAPSAFPIVKPVQLTECTNTP